MNPEDKAREKIDAILTASGWIVQTRDNVNLSASRGVAICELSFATGEPDYTLFVDGKAIGTVEAKPVGITLTSVEGQSAKYLAGVPAGLPAWDNPLFEGGAGETIRRELLKQVDVHTLLRLPTGIFYAQGVKANVLFFDRNPAQEKPWTEKLWIYDLRTNKHFTLKENTLKRSDLDDFVTCYNPKNRHRRVESERFKGFAYDELLKRDKVNLDIFWLKDEALEESANLPAPEIIAQEITDDLEAALEQFATIGEDLK